MKRHSAHVDADVLAELSAGLISGKRATRIHAHLAGCQHCARLSADLTEISSMLASVSSPAMPDHVTRRLNAALAQEAAQRSAAAVTDRPAARSGSDGAAAGVLTFRSPRGRRRGFTSPVAARAFAAAAAVCVVAGGTYAAVELSSNGPSPSSGHSQAGEEMSARSAAGDSDQRCWGGGGGHARRAAKGLSPKSSAAAGLGIFSRVGAWRAMLKSIPTPVNNVSRLDPP